MSNSLKIIYVAHSLRSDWNNGNAHFLRGLMRAMKAMGHRVTILEPEHSWSYENLHTELHAQRSIDDFYRLYPDLVIQTYPDGYEQVNWTTIFDGCDIVLFHEWNPPLLAQRILKLRDALGFRLLFHDTHHRASSSPAQIAEFGLAEFDGIVAFGRSLEALYRERFRLERVWTLHEAADTSIFFPMANEDGKREIVWIGNWGEGERSREIDEYLLQPATSLGAESDFTIYGVRYPEDGLRALGAAHVRYGGYLPNLDAPGVYARAALTVHIPRQQYSSAMIGIPTIRVFEALACGVPLLSAPWNDVEQLFRPGDFRFAGSAEEMTSAMREIFSDPAAAENQARRGLETVLARHTCEHRALELTAICEEVLA